ncbi:hypothetical protein D3C85_1031870 [compost metagenome]
MATSPVTAFSALAPHSAKAEVMPHGRPASASVAKFNTTSATPPQISGHGPCNSEAGRAVREANEITWPWRRFSSAVAAQAISTNTARLAMSAGASPQVLMSEVGASAGRLDHQPKLAVAITEPTMKNSSVTTMRVLPPPTANSVPEAQPPPSCMPMPNRKAPSTTDTPGGETRPATGWPNSVPAARNGKNSSTPTPSMNICARRPAPRRSDTNTRQAWVKPNDA